MDNRYPSLEINLKHLRSNIEVVRKKCEEQGICIAGVVKGATGLKEVAECFRDAGVQYIATSRMDQIVSLRKGGMNYPMMLIRVPMMSECSDIAEYVDCSLQSELTVIRAVNMEAKRRGRVHDIILMADLGDLREGFWDKEAFLDCAEYIEKELENIHLLGIGTNVGCYGSVLATNEKLSELVDLSKKVEERIGRKLEIVSGGATSSLMRIWDHDIPDGINQLRVGEGVLFARDLAVYYGYDMSMLHHDVFKLKAEVIEVKVKPTHPVGELAIDAFCRTPHYEDRGMRKRALVAIGRVDFGDLSDIFPKEKGIALVGCSSDHTILDVEDCERELVPGDIVEFDIDYGSLIYLSSTRTVNIRYI